MNEINRQIEIEQKEKEEEIYLKMYLAMYQKMDKDTFISYEEFRNNSKQQEDSNYYTNMTDEEILKDLENVKF